MVKKCTLFFLLIIINTFAFYSCKTATYPIDTELTTNSKASEKKPYLILISLDGFRWDYVERFNPPHLNDFIKNGVNAES